MTAFMRECLGLAAVLCLAVTATVWEKKVSERTARLEALSTAAWEAPR